jgi:RNA polymerase sigma-70 factor (ECF subfamily)
MHNVHVNQFALRKRRLMEVPLDGEEGVSPSFEIPVRASQFHRVELAEVLAQIGELPVEQREVLMLAVVEELRYEDIARLQGVPIGTVMSRLSRAREKLRRTHSDASSPPKLTKNEHGPATPGTSRTGRISVRPVKLDL